MSDKTDNVTGAIEAVAGLVKSVPIYQDALQPAAIEVGKALGTLAKTIHVALAPISALVWGYDQIKDFVSLRVSEKLKNVPTEDICTPNPMVVGPALEALKYTGHEPTLSEMYANLLATSLDSTSAAKAHPAFVEIIRQLTPHEAKLIELLTKRDSYPTVCIHRDSHSSRFSSFFFSNEHAIYGTFCHICIELMELPERDALAFFDNLLRLKILELDVSTSQRVNDRTSWLPDNEIRSAHDLFELEQQQNETIRFTTFGFNFVEACVKSKA
jgi:hypothetical protein